MTPDTPGRAISVFPIVGRISEVGLRYRIHELSTLANACRLKVMKSVVQKRDKIDPASVVGKGKLQEIRELASAIGVDTIIFDFDLSPSQLRNIRDFLDLNILDRSEIILEIFSRNARTKESKLQVEFARLRYELPRLVGRRQGLEQFQIGLGAGAGKFAGRGPGEKQIEYDKRAIKRRLLKLKQEISAIESGKKMYLKQKSSENFIVTIVGYTNAGKSTLFNRLTGCSVATRDAPFSTLATKSALIKISGNLRVYLMDTVGFIQDIPHDLITSFMSTLEDVRQADVLIHVVDASFDGFQNHMAVVRDTLGKLNASDKPVLTVFNKKDLLTRRQLSYITDSYPGAVIISAATGENIEGVINGIYERAAGSLVDMRLKIPVTEGKLLSELYENSSIKSRTMKNSHLLLRVTVPKREAYKYEPYRAHPAGT